jgi:hypothetical protein
MVWHEVTREAALLVQKPFSLAGLAQKVREVLDLPSAGEKSPGSGLRSAAGVGISLAFSRTS